MNVPRSSLAMALFIALGALPVGFEAGWLLYSGGGRNAGAGWDRGNAEAGENRAGPGTADFGKNSALLAEWIRFREEAGDGHNDFQGLAGKLEEMPEGFRKQAFQALLLADWAGRDPAGGLEYFLGGQGGVGTADKAAGAGVVAGPERREWGTKLFLEWLAREPGAAMDKLLGMAKAAGDLAADPKVLGEVARRAPGQLAVMAGLLRDKEDVWRHPVEDAFAGMAAKDPESARTAAEGLQGPRRAGALSGVAKAWGARDFPAAERWAKALPEGAERDAALRGAVLGLASVDPAGALEKMDSVPPGNGNRGTGYFVMQAAAARDLEATMDWLRDHPGKAAQADLSGLSEILAQRLGADPVAFLESAAKAGTLDFCWPGIQAAVLSGGSTDFAGIWNWTKAQPASPAVESLKKALRDSAANFNADLVLTIGKDLASDPAESSNVDRLAYTALGGSISSSVQMEKFLAAASPAFRKVFLPRAFDDLKEDTLGAGPQWVPRLEELPPENRPGSLRNLARVWGLKSTQEAAAWALSLPEADQTAAVGGLAGGWLAWNALEASRWVDTLPPGRARDHGSLAVVTAVAADSPEEAWQWALSIRGEALRVQALDTALEAFLKRGPGEVLERVQQSDLPEGEKLRLREKVSAAAAAAGSPSGGAGGG